MTGKREINSIYLEKEDYIFCDKIKKKYSFILGNSIGIIYRFENRITKENYIGRTSSRLMERIKHHLLLSRNSKRRYKNLIADNIKKYGITNFDFSILYIGENTEILEKYFITKYAASLNIACSNLVNKHDIFNITTKKLKNNQTLTDDEKKFLCDMFPSWRRYEKGRKEVVSEIRYFLL